MVTCKVSVATTNKGNWVVGVQAVHGNPFDGHTLAQAIKQVERLTNRSVKEAFVDKGYRGHDYQGDGDVHIARQHTEAAGPALRKRKKRRSAIEPVIGHMKSDSRMDRNYLKGAEGDRINALLAGIGVNFRKLLAALLRAERIWRQISRLWRYWRTLMADIIAISKVQTTNPSLAKAA